MTGKSYERKLTALLLKIRELMEQNESDARSWARDQAIAKTEKYQQQIQSLHQYLLLEIF